MKEPDNIIHEVFIGEWKKVSRSTWLLFKGHKRWRYKDENKSNVISPGRSKWE